MTYSQLLNMGLEHDDGLCMEAAKMYPKDINQAIDFILKHADQYAEEQCKKNKSIEKCRALKRLINALKFYKANHDDIKQHTSSGR